jgi:hypothetical protein
LILAISQSVLQRWEIKQILEARNLIFANSWDYSVSANLQISFVCQSANPLIFIANLQIANPQISTKYCTTLTQKSHKTCLLS